MNWKAIAGLAVGGLLGWHVGNAVVSSDIGKWGGGAVGAYAGYAIGKRI